MSKSRQLSIVGALAIFLFMFGFGTEAWGQVTWTGPTTGNWETPGNWSSNSVPTATQSVVFPTGSWSVSLSTVATVADMTVLGGLTLTVANAAAHLICNNLTVTGVTLFLDMAVRNTNNLISAEGLVLTNAIIKRGATTYPVYIELGRGDKQGGGTVSMYDVPTSYIGSGITTYIDNPDALLTPTEKLFYDDLTFTTAANDKIPLGEGNLYLGKDCTLSVPDSTVGSTGGYIAIKQGVDPHSPVGIGRLCLEYVDVVGCNSNWYVFPVGPDAPNGKCVKPALQVVSAYGTGVLPTGVPFPYISTRVVNTKHPDNNQTPNFQMYWVVQGVGTPDTDPNGGSVCLVLAFPYLQAYLSAGGNADIYSARYTDNWEDGYTGSNPPFSGWGYWDNTGSQLATGVTSVHPLGMGFCPVPPGPCVPGFGDFTFGVGTDPMPVELTSFSARVVDDQVKLNWETATELNNYGFYVERSVDSENWKEIGFVPGYGTSFSPKSYVYFDELGEELQRLPELSYRLRQVDRDGTTDYSNIVNVRTGELPEGVELYAAYPNPFNPATTISFAIGTPAKVTLKVYNTLGQAVATILSGSAMDAGLHTVGFDGAQLPSGVYLAVLEANGAVQHQKLVLNK